MRMKRPKECTVTVIFCIRGQIPEAAGLPCAGWEQAIRRAQCWLPHFEQRNPWLYFDSRKQKLYVLLDPDIDPPIAHQSKRAESIARTMTKKGTYA